MVCHIQQSNPTHLNRLALWLVPDLRAPAAVRVERSHCDSPTFAEVADACSLTYVSRWKLQGARNAANVPSSARSI